MDIFSSFSRSIDVLRDKTGVVIPIYLPEGVDHRAGEELLRDTVVGFCSQIGDPASICLSVDGEKFGLSVANRLAKEFGVSVCAGSVNCGKLKAVACGMRVLFNENDLNYIAVVDQDGDHFGNELLNFIRVGMHIAVETGTDRILVLGRRISRHRPMGFFRGELEEYVDRILLDALSYRAVVRNRPLRMEHVFALEEFPDFHSGYKLFSRSTASKVFLEKAKLVGVSETCYYRHACEAVMVVEALESGAYLGTVNRSTLNEQPISTFGMMNRCRLMADKIIWPCKRLQVPFPFVKQWMANHIPRLLLNTLAPDGREELEEIRQLVLEGFDVEKVGDLEKIVFPLFV